MTVRDKNITWGLLDAYKINLTKERKDIIQRITGERRDKSIHVLDNTIAEVERIQHILEMEVENSGD